MRSGMDMEGYGSPSAQSTQAWLVTTDGQEFALQGDGLTCGRSNDNDLVLADNQVSRRHARFERRPEGFVVADLGSSNGTNVNGQEVRSRAVVLSDGDRLEIG